MKNKLLLYTFLILSLSSCISITRQSREEVRPPLIYVQRGDYEITEDLTASADVTIKSFGFIETIIYDNKKQTRIGPFVFGDRDYNIGSFEGYKKPKELDEQIAMFNFINEHNNIDYVTNIKFKKTYTHHPYIGLFNIGKREMKTTIIAKGIILKNKGTIQK
jgi:hypothetical protein